MFLRQKLFTHKDPYDLEGTNALFLEAVKNNLEFHIKNCPEYKRILEQAQFNPESVVTIEDLHKIPVLPTLFYKSHQLFSMTKKRLPITVSSSGTKGKKSMIGYNIGSLYLALRMAIKICSYYKLLSLRPTNYIVLGYQYSRHNQKAVSKTAFVTTLMTPAVHREYALKYTKDGYIINFEGIKKALLRYAKQPFPVRFIGFPYYTYLLVLTLKEQGIKLQLPPHSKIFIAGGWKQTGGEVISKKELYVLIEETLGVKEENCKDFFGAAEHSILHCDCKNHHFHVPVYCRVIIRDVDTFQPVPNGTPGILNLITPLTDSVPLVSIVTDDLAVLHDASKCGCGITSPYFEILGRAGVTDIKTCAAGAAELLGGLKR